MMNVIYDGKNKAFVKSFTANEVVLVDNPDDAVAFNEFQLASFKKNCSPNRYYQIPLHPGCDLNRWIDPFKELPIGSVFYIVRVPQSGGKHSFIEKHTILDRPYYNKFHYGADGAYFVKTKNHNGVNAYIDEIALSSAGIIKNKFNAHKTFKTIDKAYAYLGYLRASDYTRSLEEVTFDSFTIDIQDDESSKWQFDI